MNSEFGYLLAFSTGLMGAFHCLGMCGSFAGGYFAGHGWQRKLLPQATYHSIRIITYMVLGISGAVIGRVLAQSGIVGKGQGLLMILAGLLILVIGLGLTGRVPGLMRVRSCVPSQGCQVVKFEARPRAASLFPAIAGLLNGLVPCSLVFSVALKAAATGQPVQAGLLMLSFGLGTLPTMGLVTTLGAAIGRWGSNRLPLITGIMVMLLGAWTLYEGVVFFDIMRGLAN